MLAGTRTDGSRACTFSSNADSPGQPTGAVTPTRSGNRRGGAAGACARAGAVIAVPNSIAIPMSKRCVLSICNGRCVRTTEAMAA